MPNDTEYTPTTDEIREYVEVGGEPRPWESPSEKDAARAAAFDRWLAAHDREVAAKALRDWADMQERTLENFAYVADDCDRAETSQWCKAIRLYADRIVSEPGTPEQEGTGTEIDEAEVERIAKAATAHNSGQTVYEVSRASGILRVVMSSWPRAKEATAALAGAGYTVAQDGNNVMVLAAPTESEGTP